MKILITGAAGQLGSDLTRVLQADHELFALSKTELNVVDADQVFAAVHHARPEVILHAAAYTKVDLAETDSEMAYRVNAIGTRNVAVAAQTVKAKMVYISTDYVFDGHKGEPYHEFDETSPLNIYGRSKLAGEQFVKAFSDTFFIVRTSWLYGRNGSNYVNNMIARSLGQEPVSAACDQVGSPTYTLDLAVFIGHLIRTKKYGCYHVSNSGCCSRYDFTKEIFQAIHMNHIILHPVRAVDFNLPAARPLNSALDSLAIRLNGLPVLRDWKSALHAYVNTL
ncbi:MAG TPA: dTDP-4-dehydrorhamnose reductase [Bacilli bacterium]